MPTVQQLAQQYSPCFERLKRDNGEEYVRLKDGSPAELKELCQHAHAELLPDDWRYQFIEEAIDALAETEDPDEIQLEADIYTSDLTGWLHSLVTRIGYCDEALQEFGEPRGMFELLQWCQLREKEEVLALVREWLEERAGSEAE